MKKGFTLIELMIVIAIIAILAAILVPNFLRARAQSQLAACESNEKNTATALEMYATDNSGNYPTGTSLALLTPNYMRAIPTCPSNSSNYGYTGFIGPAAYTVYQAGSSNPHAKAGLVNANGGCGSGAMSEPCYGSGTGLMTK